MALAPEFEERPCRDVLSIMLGIDKPTCTTIDPLAMQIEQPPESVTIVLARSLPQLELV